MPTSRSNSRSQNALAIAQQGRLQQYTARSSNLTRLLEHDHKPTRLQRRIAEETRTRAGTMQLASLLNEWADEQINQTHVRTAYSVLQTLQAINQIAYLPLDELTAKDMAAWLPAQKQTYLRHKATLLEASVGYLTERATSPLPSEDDKPNGVMGWLRQLKES